MIDYLDGRIEARRYQEGIFTLMQSRARFTEEEFRILQIAYGDADDYDADVRLEYTILEPELRHRIAESVEALIALEHDRVRVDRNPSSS
jgi:hypothetical protein